MTNYSEYFSKVTYKPKYFLGDRVRGFYKKIPFSGSVGVDTLVCEEDGPYVIVFLDLPIKINDVYHTMIKVKHKSLLKTTESYELDSKTTGKKSSMDSGGRSKKSRKSSSH